MLNSPYGTIPQVTSHLLGSRLVTLNYFHQGRASVLSLLEQTLTLDADLHFLHAVLLPKLPSGDLENALFTIMIFHTILLPIKEITSQQREYGNGPRLVEFTTLAQLVKVTQLYLILCDPMDYTAHGIIQARILEWVAIPFSRGSSQPRDRTQVSRIAGRFFTS